MIEVNNFADAIEAFKQEHPEYGTPEGARDKCSEASAQFIDHLIELDFLDPACRRREWENMEIDVVDNVSHQAARIGIVMIDWTARQFDPEADWPKITIDARCWP